MSMSPSIRDNCQVRDHIKEPRSSNPLYNQDRRVLVIECSVFSNPVFRATSACIEQCRSNSVFYISGKSRWQKTIETKTNEMR